ncbi:MAG: hypothetical protein ABII07_02125 [Patescibacteria group bacterium]|nr:hypothetical protein [Patescibacteria group bacterium]
MAEYTDQNDSNGRGGVLVAVLVIAGLVAVTGLQTGAFSKIAEEVSAVRDCWDAKKSLDDNWGLCEAGDRECLDNVKKSRVLTQKWIDENCFVK